MSDLLKSKEIACSKCRKTLIQCKKEKKRIIMSDKQIFCEDCAK